MSAPSGAINLRFGNTALPYKDVICASDHSQRPREPQRYFRDVGNKSEEYQHRAQPRQHRDRDFAKLRLERANARMDARRNESQDQQKPNDPLTRLRERADNMANSAAALKKIADASDPLYKTLDDGQKRRLAILTHMEGRLGRGWRRHDFEHGMMGGDRDHDRHDGRDNGGGGGPERL